MSNVHDTNDDATVRYERLYGDDDGIARIVMNRPEARNAQSVQMTYDLNMAFDRAAGDDAVKVIIVSGAGPHFSAGHDLRDRTKLSSFTPVGTWCGFDLPGHEGYMAREEEVYLGMCRRWRNLPKPTIAQVHGRCIAGGLMLAWVCDLIIASDDATFVDPVLTMGVNGVEWFAHPWELGPRKAKEHLFTADAWDAQEAHRLGMVNHVIPRNDLESFTLAMARRIATKPSFALKLTKESVNQTLDAQGQWTAMQATFSMHQIAHSHNMQRFGIPVDPGGLQNPPKPAPPSAPSASIKP
jgi:enoyl-CoA hydratase